MTSRSMMFSRTEIERKKKDSSLHSSLTMSMSIRARKMIDHCPMNQQNIVSKTNLTLCRADYFQLCWCSSNSSVSPMCSYLLHHVDWLSNSSYFCIYHSIRLAIECFPSSAIFLPKNLVSSSYLRVTMVLFILGLLGNGFSTIILISTKLRRSNVYRNLIILCLFNIFYLFILFIRYENIFQQDLRTISVTWCQWHTFLVAFLGHLCSWQLVSTSIQRVHGLLSLQSQRTTSWTYTWSVLLMGIVLPLFVFDGQLLFNYGLFAKESMCSDSLNSNLNQFQYALNHPLDLSLFSTDIPIRYHFNWTLTSPTKSNLCILWNILDTIIYAIVPFLITVICNILIIIQVCHRRRTTVILGGVYHGSRDIFASHDQLSTLLIVINILFLLMTGPLNISLLIQSIFDYVSMPSFRSNELFFRSNEYFYLLQNAYHAGSFLFYCVVGNKFRSSARSLCQQVYWKCFQCGLQNRCVQSSMDLCRRLDRRHSSSSGQTVSTVSKLSINNEIHRRVLVEQPTIDSVPLNVIKRTAHVTFQSTTTRQTIERTTAV